MCRFYRGAKSITFRELCSLLRSFIINNNKTPYYRIDIGVDMNVLPFSKRILANAPTLLMRTMQDKAKISS